MSLVHPQALEWHNSTFFQPVDFLLLSLSSSIFALAAMQFSQRTSADKNTELKMASELVKKCLGCGKHKPSIQYKDERNKDRGRCIECRFAATMNTSWYDFAKGRRMRQETQEEITKRLIQQQRARLDLWKSRIVQLNGLNPADPVLTAEEETKSKSRITKACIPLAH